MYKIGIIVQLVMLLSFMSGCDRENVGELRRELEELEKQLKVLQSWQEKVNENLKTLQKLLEGLNQGKYVTSVMETSAGCTIILDQEFVLQIRNGEKGEDGRSVGIVTPSVSVYDSLDGHMYWTIGGILVKNDQGECIRVDGESGEQGGNRENKVFRDQKEILFLWKEGWWLRRSMLNLLWQMLYRLSSVCPVIEQCL